MSRPEFPAGCALPVGAIDAINRAQQEYDRDPSAWERRERDRKEQAEREAWEENEARLQAESERQE